MDLYSKEQGEMDNPEDPISDDLGASPGRYIHLPAPQPDPLTASYQRDLYARLERLEALLASLDEKIAAFLNSQTPQE